MKVMTRIAAGLVVGLVLALAACGDDESASGGGEGSAPKSVSIAYQPGLAYAQLLIMRNQRWIEADYPDTKVTFRELASGSAIRDSMLADEVQVGAVGTAPFLVGWDKGIDWKLIANLSDMELWLNAKDANIKSLEDLQRGGKIALPAPDSIQSVVLRKGASDELGDAKAFDRAMVAMPHPDGVQALLSGQITAHLTSPPFQSLEVDEGAHTIYKSSEAFGDASFNSLALRNGFYEDHPEFAAKLLGYIERANRMIEEQPDKVAQILSKETGGETSAAEWRKQLEAPGVKFSAVPIGYLKYAEFMKEVGLIEKVPENAEEIQFPPLHGKGGS